MWSGVCTHDLSAHEKGKRAIEAMEQQTQVGSSSTKAHTARVCCSRRPSGSHHHVQVETTGQQNRLGSHPKDGTSHRCSCPSRRSGVQGAPFSKGERLPIHPRSSPVLCLLPCPQSHLFQAIPAVHAFVVPSRIRYSAGSLLASFGSHGDTRSQSPQENGSCAGWFGYGTLPGPCVRPSRCRECVSWKPQRRVRAARALPIGGSISPSSPEVYGGQLSVCSGVVETSFFACWFFSCQ
mmetsp:Transcript_46881/g.120844  ORF Transcript_46881/g.120844 Transcript_46881/m.120844 type:complete len:237 (+) Transcript_46881:1556-2266(+)